MRRAWRLILTNADNISEAFAYRLRVLTDIALLTNAMNSGFAFRLSVSYPGPGQSNGHSGSRFVIIW